MAPRETCPRFAARAHCVTRRAMRAGAGLLIIANPPAPRTGERQAALTTWFVERLPPEIPMGSTSLTDWPTFAIEVFGGTIAVNVRQGASPPTR
jgi:hypothetical protein